MAHMVQNRPHRATLSVSLPNRHSEGNIWSAGKDGQAIKVKMFKKDKSQYKLSLYVVKLIAIDIQDCMLI